MVFRVPVGEASSASRPLAAPLLHVCGDLEHLKIRLVNVEDLSWRITSSVTVGLISINRPRPHASFSCYTH